MFKFKEYLSDLLPDISEIKKITAEASVRRFYRLYYKNKTLIAMFYPDNCKIEIERFINFNTIYKQAGLNVPDILDVLDDRVIIVQDLGDLLLQKRLRICNKNEFGNVLKQIKEIIETLQAIGIGKTDSLLDFNRMDFEMNFFLDNFYKNYQVYCRYFSESDIKNELNIIIEKVSLTNVFSHRDFHTRNIIFFENKLFLVDFQDSLRANRYYDHVSFIFDSYFDFDDYRNFYLDIIKDNEFETDMFYLTALERNIKALGTFGYQVFERDNKKYSKYIKRTLRNIINNPYISTLLKTYFINIYENI